MNRTYQSRAATPLVSVVTPFYNEAEWLAECIESVLNQTHSRFEYLLFDNCSTDGSSAVAEQYAHRDSRVRYVRNRDFLSQMQNYNAALASISPESQFTKIVAADDALRATCLASMLALAEAHPRIGVVGAVAVRGSTPHNTRQAADDWPFETRVVSGREAAAYQLRYRKQFVTSPTTVMYRSSIVRSRDPFFDDWRPNADTYALFEILRHWDFGFVPDVLTFVRSREAGVSAGILALDPLCNLLDHFILIKGHGPEFLAHSDFVRCWEAVRQEYLEHLARNFVTNRRTEFWQYHQQGWESVGCSITRWTLIGEAMRLGLRIGRDPARLGQILSRSVNVRSSAHSTRER